MTPQPDLVVRHGVVVDGTRREPFDGDVAIARGRIIEVGRVSASGRIEIDARGAFVTPASSTSTPTTTARSPGRRASFHRPGTA
jgi:N-acyl-D-aspartate/D-glutamate deacylase